MRLLLLLSSANHVVEASDGLLNGLCGGLYVVYKWLDITLLDHLSSKDVIRMGGSRDASAR